MGAIVLIGYFLPFLLVGALFAYFLNSYIVLILAVASVVLILKILGEEHQAESGLGALFISGFIVAFLLGLIAGSLPYVPWGDLRNHITSLDIIGFFKKHILR